MKSSSEPGRIAILTYPVQFDEIGRYYIWARAFSTGTEDNGAHFGLDGVWQESSQRLQFCEGKNWSIPDAKAGLPIIPSQAVRRLRSSTRFAINMAVLAEFPPTSREIVGLHRSQKGGTYWSAAS